MFFDITKWECLVYNRLTETVKDPNASGDFAKERAIDKEFLNFKSTESLNKIQKQLNQVKEEIKIQNQRLLDKTTKDFKEYFEDAKGNQNLFPDNWES